MALKTMGAGEVHNMAVSRPLRHFQREKHEAVPVEEKQDTHFAEWRAMHHGMRKDDTEIRDSD